MPGRKASTATARKQVLTPAAINAASFVPRDYGGNHLIDAVTRKSNLSLSEALGWE